MNDVSTTCAIVFAIHTQSGPPRNVRIEAFQLAWFWVTEWHIAFDRLVRLCLDQTRNGRRYYCSARSFGARYNWRDASFKGKPTVRLNGGMGLMNHLL